MSFILIFSCLAAGMVLQQRSDIKATEMAHSLNLYVISVACPYGY